MKYIGLFNKETGKLSGGIIQKEDDFNGVVDSRFNEVEITEDQKNNSRYLSLIDGKVKIDTAKKAAKEARKNIANIEKQIADWCKAKGKREAYYFRLTKTTSEYVEYKEFCESIGA